VQRDHLSLESKCFGGLPAGAGYDILLKIMDCRMRCISLRINIIETG